MSYSLCSAASNMLLCAVNCMVFLIASFLLFRCPKMNPKKMCKNAKRKIQICKLFCIGANIIVFLFDLENRNHLRKCIIIEAEIECLAAVCVPIGMNLEWFELFVLSTRRTAIKRCLKMAVRKELFCFAHNTIHIKGWMITVYVIAIIHKNSSGIYM